MELVGLMLLLLLSFQLWVGRIIMAVFYISVRMEEKEAAATMKGWPKKSRQKELRREKYRERRQRLIEDSRKVVEVGRYDAASACKCCQTQLN